MVLTIVNIFIFGKSKGFLMKGLIVLLQSNNSITPKLSYYGRKLRVKFNGSCLKQGKITYTHGAIANIFIVYEISKHF